MTNEVVKLLLSIYRNQVSLLIILDESDNGVGKPDHMGPCAQAVMKAAENLIKIGKERANNSPDQVVPLAHFSPLIIYAVFYMIFFHDSVGPVYRAISMSICKIF